MSVTPRAYGNANAMALLMAAFTEGDRRNRALGYWGAVGSAGAIVGQLPGGVLTTAFGWRANFLINVPIGIVTIAAAARHLADSRSPTQPRLDVRGAALLTAGLAAVILTLTRVADGTSLMSVIVNAQLAGLLLDGFARNETRDPEPLIDRRLLRTPHVATGNLLLAINAGILGGALFFTTLYLQVTLGYSALAVGAAFAPITLVILMLSPHVGARVATVGVRPLLTAGFACSAVGTGLLARLPQDGTYLLDVLPGLALIANRSSPLRLGPFRPTPSHSPRRPVLTATPGYVRSGSCRGALRPAT